MYFGSVLAAVSIVVRCTIISRVELSAKIFSERQTQDRLVSTQDPERKNKYPIEQNLSELVPGPHIEP